MKTLMVNLTEEEFQILSVMAGAAGLSRTKVIESFVADLTESGRSNGSDERDDAFVYFDRALYGSVNYGPANRLSWLQELLIRDGFACGYENVQDVLRVADDIEDHRKDLQSIDPKDPDLLDDWKQIEKELDELKKELRMEFQTYQKNTGRSDDAKIDDELQQLRFWMEEYKKGSGS